MRLKGAAQISLLTLLLASSGFGQQSPPATRPASSQTQAERWHAGHSEGRNDENAGHAARDRDAGHARRRLQPDVPDDDGEGDAVDAAEGRRLGDFRRSPNGCSSASHCR